jgi:hypothetical protein
VLCVLHSPPQGGVSFWAKKCARSDINKGMIGMQKPREERLTELLKEIRQELDCIIHPCNLHVEMVRNLVAKLIELQIEEKHERRWYPEQVISATCEAIRETSNDPEGFYQSLCLFDLGLFAYSLGYCLLEDIGDVVEEIWRERKIFIPNLSDAIYVAYLFAIHLRKGKGPKRSFRYALREPNTMHKVFKVFRGALIYGEKPIGHVLGSAALTRLKELLRAYALAHPHLL